MYVTNKRRKKQRKLKRDENNECGTQVLSNYF